MTAPIFWKGLLLLAVGVPQEFPSNGNPVWISGKGIAKVQSFPGRVNIYPIAEGDFYVSGVGKAPLEPIHAVVWSYKNLEVFKHCQNKDAYEFKEGRLSVSEALFKAHSLCPMKEFRFDGEEVSEESTQLFVENEKKLLSQKIIAQLGRWDRGRRILSIAASPTRADFILQSMPVLLRPFYQILSHETAKPGNTLLFELTLFEFSRQRAIAKGLRWPNSMNILSVDPSGRAYLNLQNAGATADPHLLLAGDFGESQGVGKVLAQPTLRVQPGVESHFLSGGEFAVKNQNAFHSETQWKDYGLKVVLKPGETTQIGDNEVSVDFKLEFSEPDPNHMIDDLPMLIQRQLQSRFDLRLNETTVLTSMLTLREDQARDGLYGLDAIPIFGALFGAHRHTNNDSELWFALRPSWEDIPQKSVDRKLEYDNGL